MTCTCCQPLSESQRTDYPASLFGPVDFPFRIEPTILTSLDICPPTTEVAYGSYMR
jgi:hypothetical protein